MDWNILDRFNYLCITYRFEILKSHMREQPKVGLNDSAHLKDLNHHLNVRIGELALSLKQVLIVGGLSIFGFFCFGYYKFG